MSLSLLFSTSICEEFGRHKLFLMAHWFGCVVFWILNSEYLLLFSMYSRQVQLKKSKQIIKIQIRHVQIDELPSTLEHKTVPIWFKKTWIKSIPLNIWYLVVARFVLILYRGNLVFFLMQNFSIRLFHRHVLSFCNT